MPELPEVETIRRDLAAHLIGETIQSFRVSDPRFLSVQEQRRWIRILTGQSLKTFGRKGKYLWLHLANGYRLFIHLRMTGQLILGKLEKRHPRMCIGFASGKSLSLFDQRRFAEGWLIGPEETWRPNHPLGPDALDELDVQGLCTLLKGKTTKIQPLLLDQQRVAGIGNIYAQEALFKASIRPTRPSKRITRHEVSTLFAALRETLETAIVHRGSSSRNYTDGEGKRGGAQLLHAVYRKGGQACVRCRTTLRSIRVGGRGSVFCPQCQK